MDVGDHDNSSGRQADMIPDDIEDESQAQLLVLELLSDLISRCVGIVGERSRVAEIFKQTSKNAVSSLIKALEIFAFAHSFQETESTDTMNKLMEQPPDVVIDAALARARIAELSTNRAHNLLRLFKHQASPIRMRLPQLRARASKSSGIPAKSDTESDSIPSDISNGRKPGQVFSVDTASTKPVNLKTLVLCDRKVVALAATSKSLRSHSPIQRRRTKYLVCNSTSVPTVWHAISPGSDASSAGDVRASGSQSIQLQYSIQTKCEKAAQRRDGRIKKVSARKLDEKPLRNDLDQDPVASLSKSDLNNMQDTNRSRQSFRKYQELETAELSNPFLQMSLSPGVKISIEPLEKLHKEQEFRWNDEKSELLTEIRTFKSKEQEARQQKMHYQKKINNQAVESQFYRERIKVLEKANERETKRRFQMEETIDELRSEMDKIRALFIKQEQGFQQRERIEKQKHEAMLEKLQLEVQKTREELHHERQCRLKEQLNRSEQKLDISKPGASSSSSPQASKSTLDVSYFLNNSAHLPDKVKGIMEEWRLKMEEALLESEKPRPDSGKAGSLLPNDREDVTREKRCKHCTATVWPKSTYVQEYTSACSSDMEPLEVRDANDSNMPPPLDDSEEVRQGITLQVNGQQHKSSTRTLGTNTVHSQHSDTGMRCNEAKYSADSFPDYDPRQKITEWEDRLQAENSHEYKELDPGVRDKLKDGRVTYPVLDVIQDSDLQLCKDIQMWYNPGHFS
ncbi:unnamed protein product [Albugo candida]|uniref:Uncharacterized protein n=1 Tax=Albugo candida TaxID=65357 RepID=A0A024GL95_9STRA|nr:unnamed protein product [Albugo candida]|eukprot:CCI47479.1 unnamed protein product [Albugo candida]